MKQKVMALKDQLIDRIVQGLLILVSLLIVSALLFQLSMVYLEVSGNEKTVRDVTNWIMWRIDGTFKNSPENIWYDAEDHMWVESVTNEVKMGKLAGNRNLEFGVKNIIEEVLQDKEYDIDPSASLQITADIVYLDVLKNSSQLSVFHKEKESVVIRLSGSIIKDGKVIKKAIAEESADETSMSTLLIDEGGKFNQQNLSSALKKASNSLVNKLL